MEKAGTRQKGNRMKKKTYGIIKELLHCAHLFPFVHGRIKGTKTQSASAGALSRKIRVISIDNLKKEKNITKREAPFANRVVSSIRFSGYSCNVEINKRIQSYRCFSNTKAETWQHYWNCGRHIRFVSCTFRFGFRFGQKYCGTVGISIYRNLVTLGLRFLLRSFGL